MSESAFQQRTAALSTGSYVGLLFGTFVMIPVLILLARRFKLSQQIDLKGLLRKVALERFKTLVLQNVELSKRPLNQQLEAYLYARSNWGLIIDCVQAVLSLVSCGLVLLSASSPPHVPDPDWAIALELVLTMYFAMDYSLRFFLASDRLAFYFSPLSLLDYITIVPGLVQILVSENAFEPGAFYVAQMFRVFRIFRVIRLMRIIALASQNTLKRQIMVLVVTVLAMVFAAAAIFQMLDSTADFFLPFHHAVLYMTITIIGRPPVPTHTDAAKIMETIAIFVGSFLIPAFIAELARLYFEQQGRDVYSPDPKTPHVILCGDVNPSRLRAFLGQFFHKSRDPELISPVVILSENKYEGSLRTLIEQAQYAGNVKYIRGSARKPADLKRAGAHCASTIIVLCHRLDVDAAAADSEVVTAALAVKNVNRRVRVLAQLRRPRSRDHLMCLPGWRDHDRAVAVSSLSMTLLGVGSLLPGLPTLLTNLIHQGNKKNARSSNPRRRKYMARSGSGAFGLQTQAAGMLVSTKNSWYTSTLTGFMGMLEATGTALLGGESAGSTASEEDILKALLRPMSPLEEYTSGFAQEMFAIAVTPGLAGRTFGAAARLAYLRFGVLLIGARVPLVPTAPSTTAAAAAAASAAANSETAYRVLLFPVELVLASGMYLHVIAFDALDLAALLQGTGAEHALKHGLGDLSAAAAAAAMSRSASVTALNRMAHGGDAALAGTSIEWTGALARHNRKAATNLNVPWCFSEQEEEAAEAVLNALDTAGQRTTGGTGQFMTVSGDTTPGGGAASASSGEGGPAPKKRELPPGVRVYRCACEHHEDWASSCAAAGGADGMRALVGALSAATGVTANLVSPLTGGAAAAPAAASASAKVPRRQRSRRGRNGSVASAEDAQGAGAGSTAGSSIKRRDTLDSRIMEGEEGGEEDRDGEGDEEEEDGELYGMDEEEEEDEEEEDEDMDLVDEDDGVDGFGDVDGNLEAHGISRSHSHKGSTGRSATASASGAGSAHAHPQHQHSASAAAPGTSSGAGAVPSTSTGARLPLAPPRPSGGAAAAAAAPPKAPALPPPGSAARRTRLVSMDAESVYTQGDDGLGGEEDMGVGVAGPSGSSSKGMRRTLSRNLSRGSAGAGSGAGAGGKSLMGPRPPSMIAMIPRGNNSRSSGGAAASGPLPTFIFNLKHLMMPAAAMATTPAAGSSALASRTAGGGFSLSPYRGHILVCGISDSVGLLLRALQTPPPSPPKAVVPGLAALLSSQVTAVADRRRSGKGDAGQYKPLQVVVLCPVSERPSDAVVNAMHAGSSRWLARVSWVNGSPTDLGDLLRAGVDSARAAVVLSTKRPQANPDGTDNLADDCDAIVVASAIYKLNPSIHLLTEVQHGPHASYLRPAGTTLGDAEESTSAFVASVRSAATMRMKMEARQKKATAEVEKNTAAALVPSARAPVRSKGKATSTSAAAAATATAPTTSATVAASAAPVAPASPGAPEPPASAAAVPAAAAAATTPPPASRSTSATPALPPVSAPKIPDRDLGPFDLDSPIAPGGEESGLAGATGIDGGDGGEGAGEGEEEEGAEGEGGDVVGALDANGAGDGSTGTFGARALASKMARERIRAALASGDSIGRTVVSARHTQRPALSSLFPAPASASAAATAAIAAAASAPAALEDGATAHGDGSGAGANSSGSEVEGGVTPVEQQEGDGSGAAAAATATSTGTVAINMGGSPAGPSSAAAAAEAGATGGAAADDDWGVGIDFAGDGGDPWAAQGTQAASGADDFGAQVFPAAKPVGRGRGNSFATAAASSAAALRRGLSTAYSKSPRLEAAAAHGDGPAPLSLGAGTGIAAADATHLHITAPPASVSAPGVATLSPSDTPSSAGTSSGAGAGAGAGAGSGPKFVGPSHKAAAPSDLFGAPAFAAGRAYSSTTLDALLCEAHFAPHIIFVIKQLVRASRKQRLQLLPAADAVSMALLVAPVHAALGPLGHDTKQQSGAAAGGRLQRPSTAWDNTGHAHVAERRTADLSDRAPPRGSFIPTGATAALLTHLASSNTEGAGLPVLPEVRTYGQLFEALVRGWHMLPVGLYRRLEPGSAAKPPVVTDPLSQFVAAFAPPTATGGDAGTATGGGNYTGSAVFRNEKGLLSYVFTNPPPDTVLNKHDLVYVLRPGGSDEGDD